MQLWRKLWLLIYCVSGLRSLLIFPENIIFWWFRAHKKEVLIWHGLNKIFAACIDFFYSGKTSQNNYLCFVTIFCNTINLWSKIRSPYFRAKSYDIGIMNLRVFKVNNRSIRTSCEICLKLTIDIRRGSGVLIVNFDYILDIEIRKNYICAKLKA